MLVDTEPAHTEPRVHRSGLVSSVGRLFSTPHLHTAPIEHIYSFLSPSHQCLWGQYLLSPMSRSTLHHADRGRVGIPCTHVHGHSVQAGSFRRSEPHMMERREFPKGRNSIPFHAGLRRTPDVAWSRHPDPAPVGSLCQDSKWSSVDNTRATASTSGYPSGWVLSDPSLYVFVSSGPFYNYPPLLYPSWCAGAGRMQIVPDPHCRYRDSWTAIQDMVGHDLAIGVVYSTPISVM